MVRCGAAMSGKMHSTAYPEPHAASGAGVVSSNSFLVGGDTHKHSYTV